MDEAVFHDTLRESLWIAVQLSAPMLGAALIAGLVIGLFQALTSIQEATLTFVPKVALLIAVFWVAMSWMTGTLVAFFSARLVPLIIGS
jgi:flagellar biosynthetic protein FliQ